MASVGDLQKNLKKKHGDKFVTSVSDIKDVERLPTGIYPVDFAMGGGFPRGKFSILWGAESTGKTNLALKAIAMNQLLYPEQVNVFIDVEGSFDPVWAKLVGVDVNPEKLAVIRPDFAEQASDIMQKAIQAEDIGVIVLDSIGSMITTNEKESTAEKASVGGSAKVVTSMMNTAIAEMATQGRNDIYPTVIIINQMRAKIGVMFGSPDTMNGGKVLAHASAMTLKIRGRDLIDTDINKDRASFKEVKGSIVKFKVPILYKAFEFLFPVINQGGLKVGYIDDWKTLSHQMKELGWLYKEGKVVHCLDKEFKTFKEVEAYFKDNLEVTIKLRESLLEHAMDALYVEKETD